MLTQKFKEQVIYLKRRLIKHYLIARWNNEVLSKVPGKKDLIKGWYSKYAFIRTHPKTDTSSFGPIIVQGVSTKVGPLVTFLGRWVPAKKLKKSETYNMENRIKVK